MLTYRVMTAQAPAYLAPAYQAGNIEKRLGNLQVCISVKIEKSFASSQLCVNLLRWFLFFCHLFPS